MPKNNTLNTTELMTGKDGRLFVEFNGKNVFLAEINSYAVNMNVNTTETQPVGSVLVQRVPTGVSFDLTFTEMVVRDDLIMEPLLAAIQQGVIPVYNFQGVTEKPDGQEQRLAFNNAVPNGTFGLQSLTPGEIVQRENSFALNSIPQFISSLASTYMQSA
jgi:hypothetical protein